MWGYGGFLLLQSIEEYSPTNEEWRENDKQRPFFDAVPGTWWMKFFYYATHEHNVFNCSSFFSFTFNLDLCWNSFVIQYLLFMPAGVLNLSTQFSYLPSSSRNQQPLLVACFLFYFDSHGPTFPIRPRFFSISFFVFFYFPRKIGVDCFIEKCISHWNWFQRSRFEWTSSN